MKLSIPVELALRSIGEQMVVSDNQATAYPVWMVKRSNDLPRMFLSQNAAEVYQDEEGGSIRVLSAHDNLEMKVLMKACLELAGKQDHKQTKNAYAGFFK